MSGVQPLPFEHRENNSLISAEMICADAMEYLPKLESNRFDLVITSPPYNIGKEYEKKKSIEKYLAEIEQIIVECVRLVSDQGSICWQVGNYVDKGEVYPLDIFYYPLFKRYGLQLRNRIIWSFGHGLHASNRFSGRYETILWFTKSENYIFNLDEVRIPAKYPGKRHFKGPKKGQLSGNPKGKNPSDVWEIVAEDWEREIWEIPNVKSNHPEKTNHPCQYPVELIERCVLALTNECSHVLDPFAGVGSTLLACLKNNRHSIGVEKEVTYVKMAQSRIDKMRLGTLKTRPVTKPIHQPSANDKVARLPEEWNSSLYDAPLNERNGKCG